MNIPSTYQNKETVLLKKQKDHRRFYRKKRFLLPVGIVLAIVLLIALAFRVSPWPGAMVIRYVFTKDGAKTTAALEKHQPSEAITVIQDQHYRTYDKDAWLDVYFPKQTPDATNLPAVIWTHGGAWISGDKKNNATYYKLLAAQGYTVISLDYSRGPEKKYPTAIHQLNDAYAYIQANSKRFHADTNQIFLAGDSAGSQLSSQMATFITSPVYAAELQMQPSLQVSQLKGVLLNCGIYKMDALVQPNPTLPKIVGWGDDVSVWAYTGSRDFSAPAIKQMSAYYHVTKDFPATYITGGNADPLTDAQSKPFAAKLTDMGVDVTSVFYAESHQPELPHEYQFNLDNADGRKAFDATVDFLKKHTD